MPDLCPEAHALLERWKNEDTGNRTYQVVMIAEHGLQPHWSCRLKGKNVLCATSFYPEASTEEQLNAIAHIIDRARRDAHMATYKPMDITP